jgi:tRNA(Ile)-lysidine synthase
MAASRKGARPDLSDRVVAALASVASAGARICVGYSGGLDSSVLLHLLAEARDRLGGPLSAIHVHHGLSAHADAWSRHCASVCAGLGVPLTVRHVSVRPAGEGIEAAARAARYRVFEELDADVLALAHHRDDQAETVLLQLLRGAGPWGLAAMPPVRRLGASGPLLARPLLVATREEIGAWARGRGLAWIDDDSNADLDLARNAARLRVLPALTAHFPHAGARLADAAGQFAETARLLDALAGIDAVGGELSVSRLAALPAERARNLLRWHLDRAGVAVRRASLREALRLVLTARVDAGPGIEFDSDAGRLVLRRYRDRLVLEPATTVSPTGRIWRGEAELALDGIGCLRFENVFGGGLRLCPGATRVAFRRGGESLRLAANRPARALKDLLREAAVPPWRRGRLPLLYNGDRLAWVAGLGADVSARAGPGENGWRVLWREDAPTPLKASPPGR